MVNAVIFDMYETLVTLLESPAYFGTQIAGDLGMDPAVFRKMWDATEHDRSIGRLTLEEALETIMRENHCYAAPLLNEVVEKRLQAKRACFDHMHPEIIPMLSALKKRKIKIGLISNCFSEEALAIRESMLFPFFDAVFLSYEQGIQKPDKDIFRRCLSALAVPPQECLYIGDGGSFELETAKDIGMTVFQAAWYLKEGTAQPSKRKPDFSQFGTPCEVLTYI